MSSRSSSLKIIAFIAVIGLPTFLNAEPKMRDKLLKEMIIAQQSGRYAEVLENSKAYHFESVSNALFDGWELYKCDIMEIESDELDFYIAKKGSVSLVLTENLENLNYVLSDAGFDTSRLDRESVFVLNEYLRPLGIASFIFGYHNIDNSIVNQDRLSEVGFSLESLRQKSGTKGESGSWIVYMFNGIDLIRREMRFVSGRCSIADELVVHSLLSWEGQ